jgi:hypothetical protein
MPHDAKGQELKPGDCVLVPFYVLSIAQTEDFCNLSLETCATMPPKNEFKTSLSAINTKMTIRANEGDDTTFVVMHVGMESRVVPRP